MYHSTKYSILDWDWCRSSTGDYFFLETHASSCGNLGAGEMWSFSFVSKRRSDGSYLVEVCHSGSHSGTTEADVWDTHGNSLTVLDSAGGGCGLQAGYFGVQFFEAQWGGDYSPELYCYSVPKPLFCG